MLFLMEMKRSPHVVIHKLKAYLVYTVEYEVRDSGTDDSKAVAEREQEWIPKALNGFLERQSHGRWKVRVRPQTKKA